MLGVDHPHPARPGQLHERPAVVLGGVPQPGHHRGELLDRGSPRRCRRWNSRSRSRNRSMSSLASISLLDLVQPVDLGVGRAAACSRPARAARAARASGRSRRPRAGSSRGTRAPLLALVLDQPLGLEHPQRLAHRQPAGAEPLGDLLLPDPLAGRELAARGSPRAGASAIALAGSPQRRRSIGLGGHAPGVHGSPACVLAVVRLAVRDRTPARTACPTGRGSRPSAGPRWAPCSRSARRARSRPAPRRWATAASRSST